MKMSRRSSAGMVRMVILGLVCASASLQTLGAEPSTHLLRFKFTPQQERHYVSQNDSEYLVEYLQNKETVPHTSMSLRHLTVQNINPDGSADVLLVLDRAYMTAKNAGVDSVYDSTQASRIPQEFAQVHQSVHKPWKARLTSLGKILPAADKSTSVEQYELIFQLPEQPIAVGETWKDSFEVSIPVDQESKLFRQVKLQRRFTLLSVENDIATISQKTVCLSPLHDPFQESQLVQRKPSGTLKFDIVNGCLIERHLLIDEKIVGSQGPGSALTVKSIKVDRLLPMEQLSQIDLTKPLVPIRVAAAPTDTTKQ